VEEAVGLIWLRLRFVDASLEPSRFDEDKSAYILRSGGEI